MRSLIAARRILLRQARPDARAVGQPDAVAAALVRSRAQTITTEVQRGDPCATERGSGPCYGEAVEYRSVVVWALVAMSLGCTSGPSGPKLWARACKHIETLDENASSAPECERSFAALPPAAADDFARCALLLKEPDHDGTTIRACLGPAGIAYVAPAEQTQARLKQVAASIERYRTTHEHPPASLAELGASAETLDAWDRPLTYRTLPEPESFSVCSLGRDGLDKTDDDMCEPAFVYFQF